MLGARLEVQEMAMCHAVEAILGGVHVHNGVEEARKFIYTHFLGRHMDMAALFRFKFPEREVARLCERLKLNPPVSRLIAETGRASVAPVFVVGVYSGRDKLGEGQGSSLSEAKFRVCRCNVLRLLLMLRRVQMRLERGISIKLLISRPQAQRIRTRPCNMKRRLLIQGQS